MSAPVTADSFREILYAPHMSAEERSNMLANKIGGGTMLAYFIFKSKLNARVDQIKSNMETPQKLAAQMTELRARVMDTSTPVTVAQLKDEFSAFAQLLGISAQKLQEVYSASDDLKDRFLVTAAAEKASSLDDEQNQSHKQYNYLGTARDRFFEVEKNLKSIQKSFNDEVLPLLQGRVRHENETRYVNAVVTGFSQGTGRDVAAPEKAAFKPRQRKF